MGTLIARVISDGCTECRDQLLEDCRDSALPPPTSNLIVVPESWADHRCPHPGGQFQLDFLPQESESVGEISGESIGWDDEGLGDVEAPDGWMNIDATKNICYPAREQGRYGSHPTHDDFDDESEP
jgi:hypothetical protein